PFLATVMLRLLGSFGPLASIGLQFEPVVNLGSYLLAVLAALVCIFALVVPAYRSSRTFNESLVAQSRQPPRSIAQRVRLDVALLVLAVVAYWQLATTGVQLGSTIRDRVGLDPLLVAAPALGIMTGAVLALRVVPMVARLGERIAARGTTPVPALS